MIEKASKEQQLASLEKIIEQSSATAEKHWFEVGKALCKIRDGKLHKQHTFEQYAWQRWGYKRSRAYQLCQTFEALKDSKKSTGVDSEIAARQLVNVPKEQREEVLEEAGKSGKVTQKSVKAAAKKKSTPKDIIEKDRDGYPIPGPAMEIWNRRDEVKDKLRSLSELRQWAEDMQGTDDPLYAEIVFSGLKLDIEKVIATLKGAVPHAVCTSCQGQAPKTCAFCKGRGMVSRFLYQSPATPEEVKVMRAMA